MGCVCCCPFSHIYALETTAKQTIQTPIDFYRHVTLKDIQERSTNPGKMARGQQKIQSQQKAQEKQAKLKKQAGQSAASRTATAAVGLKMSCKVCMAKCRILKPTSNISKTSTPRCHFRMTSRMSKMELLAGWISLT